MTQDPTPYTGPPLDEIQWRAPPVDFEAGIHNNTVLFYFARSPFFDRTSNNEILFQQGLNNPNMTPYLATRELFEGRLKTMSGLEFIVAQEPAETGPGAGTGVWVINKQTRRKRQGEPDEIIVHGTYFVVGENIYMAPSLADIISSRIASISSSIAKILPTATSVQTWSPSLGRVYQTPTNTSATATSSSSATTTTTKPQSSSTQPNATTSSTTTTTGPSSRLMEEALMLHMHFGDHHIDVNPITGRPGEFQLASTGRQPAVQLSGAANKRALALPSLPALNTKLATESPVSGTGGAGGKGQPSGKETKSPKTPGGSSVRAKKRKGSKAAVTPQ